jgi:anti-sigma regulatory factor (Ser/Thr protein kinase)
VTSASVAVIEGSQVAEARRAALACAATLRFDSETEGKVALVATELATNLVKHANGGELVVAAREDDLTTAVDLLALDSGPGMADWTRCLRDGYSTSGSPGTGLGAIRRASETFDVYSRQSYGTGVFARVASRSSASVEYDGLALGALSVSYPGETECGDAWAVMSTPTVLRVVVVDGLGHGVSAAEASRAALDAFAAGRNDSPAATIVRMHQGMRHTRGAAAAVAELDTGAGVVTFCGIGNIAGMIASAEGERHMVTHTGTLGHDARRIQLFSYPWPKGALLLLHSDGLATHWRTDDYPGLLSRHPALVAGVLYRDFRRTRDDATIVVVGPNRNSMSLDRTSQ